MAKSKITLGQVGLVAEACNAAVAQVPSFGARLKLREAMRALAPHAQDFDTERQALVNKYAEKDDDGKPVVVDDIVQFGENTDEVDRRWRELIATQVTVQHRLTLDDVAGLPGDPALDALELLLV